jgi:hypothetical protein
VEKTPQGKDTTAKSVASGDRWSEERTKKNIASLERGLHTATENHDNWTFAVGYNHEGFPNHQCRCNDKAKVDDLVCQLQDASHKYY